MGIAETERERRKQNGFERCARRFAGADKKPIAYKIKHATLALTGEDRTQVWDKVKEEISEFEVEAKQGNQDDMEKEFGDVMFSLINAARLYKINPENALEKTNRKFIRRFNYLEAHTLKQGRQLTDMSLAEMDEIWNEAKKAERAEDAGNQ